MFYDRLDRGYKKGSISSELEIELNKKMSKVMSEARKEIKSGRCYCCGKEVSSYCNSHTVPRFCLDNISNDGEVAGPNSILQLPKMGLSIGKENLGINESGTFSLICRECDSSTFQEYENPSNYDIGKLPTQKMLAQIAMKDYLKYIYKKKLEIALLEKSIKHTTPREYLEALQVMECKTRVQVYKLDLTNYTKDYERAKRFAATGNGPGYYMFFYQRLGYVVPLAIQSPITVAIDLGGNVVNDVFNMNPNIRMSDLHLCIFPLKDATAIILFVEAEEKKYRRFRKQFQKLDDNSKLGVINYLVFLYTEDYFMDKSIRGKINLQVLNETANTVPNIWYTEPIVDTAVLAEKYNLSEWKSIPNLLSQEFKIR